eukprot:778736-Prorocentrum_minimum.AAC.10
MVRGTRPSSLSSALFDSSSRSRWWSTSRAVLLSGVKDLPRHPSLAHLLGSAYLPSTNLHVRDDSKHALQYRISMFPPLACCIRGMQ